MAACWALLLTSYSVIINAQNVTALDPAQVYTTNNLVNSGIDPTSTTSAWQNIGLRDQGLPCWAPGGPVYCGPQPYFNNGSFNFSYGMTDVYQVANIAAALPNTGTGLRVNGFNFGFIAKNGNGWDNGQQDYLVAYVNVYKSDGTSAQSYNYGASTNRQYNWTTFNFSETFATPYAAKDLSTARYGFIGYDTNGWAGPYGPEITNVNFSLKYSVDPCSVDVLSSPSCPGYLDAINKLTPPATVSSSSTSTSTTTPTATTSTTPTTTTATVDVAQPVATVTATASSSTVSAPVVSTSTAATSVTPTATNPQPKVGEVTVSGSPAKTTMSTSQILSIVRNEQSRIGNLETSTAQQAIEQAQSASDKAQKDSLTISAATVSQSQASAQAAAASFATNPTQNSSMSASSGPVNNSGGSLVSVLNSRNNGSEPMKMPEVDTGAAQPSTIKSQNIYSLTTPTFVPQPGITVAMVSPQVSYTINKQNEVKSESEEQPKSEGLKFTGTNPVLNILNPAPTTTSQSVEAQPQSSAVNTRVQDNDAANGGVTLAAMAKQPQGFQAYMTALPDSAFYAPKEIYKNQRVVDNARAQRLLSGASDRLHQEMVESQYKIGDR